MRVTMGIAFVLLLAVVPALPAQDDKTKEELKKFEGTWTIEKAELGGTEFPEELRKSVKLTMKDGTYKVDVNGMVDEGKTKIEVDKKPKTMDIIGEKGPNAGKTVLAIYELDGDTLKICYALEGDRPKEFKSVKDTQTFLVTYKRQK